MITESRHSPLSYLRAKGIEPDWAVLYDAFGEPDSMRIGGIDESEMSVDTGPGGVGYSTDWTTEYEANIRFELSFDGGRSVDAVDHAGVRDAFDGSAAVSKAEWSPLGVHELWVEVELIIRERFESPDKSATEPTYTAGDHWDGIDTVDWPTAEAPDYSTAQGDVDIWSGDTMWVTASIGGEKVRLSHDGDAWVDGEGNRYHIETDGELGTDD